MRTLIPEGRYKYKVLSTKKTQTDSGLRIVKFKLWLVKLRRVAYFGQPINWPRVKKTGECFVDKVYSTKKDQEGRVVRMVR